MGLQRAADGGATRPPGETPLRKPFLAQPKPLAIVDKNLHRRSLAAAKDEDAAAQGILLELLPADTRQAIHAFSEIDQSVVLYEGCEGHGMDAKP